MPRTRGEDRINKASEAHFRTKLGDKTGAAIRAANYARQQTANAVLSTGTVGIATTVTQVRTGAVLTYKIGGVLKSKAATDNFWTLTGATLADGMTRKYALLIDAGGAASVVASNDAKTIAGCVFNVVTQCRMWLPFRDSHDGCPNRITAPTSPLRILAAARHKYI